MATLNRASPASLVLLALAAAGACSSDPASSAQPAAPLTPVLQAAGHEQGPHNLQWIKGGPGESQGEAAGLLSGSVPESDADFAHLRDLGIRTIISVDGASPDVARASRYGLSYIHIPTTYARVTPQEQLQVARAVRASMADGSVFIHCHHGKHRSPAQAAGAAVALGWLSPSEAVEFMKKAGTAPTYEGLYACVAEALPAGADALGAPIAPGEFVPVKKPDGLVASMIEVDLAYEHLGMIRNAGWTVPADQPDLVPAAEAGRLADHLRTSGEDQLSKAKGDAYMAALGSAIGNVSALEEALVRKEPAAALEKLWTPVAASCKDCHKQYRDKR
ncbi:MAG TPA: hypothetical protein VEB22_00420 [Phycisphaerales bacterium]|nr:hypothetical protein [Phycisphaerales bacterium]